MLEFSPASMARLVLLFFGFGILVFVARCEQVETNDLSSNFVFPEEKLKKDRKICSTEDVQAFSRAFHNCFTGKKYKDDGGKDLENLVGRILDQTKLCIENSTRSCRPNLKGFVAMMDQVILQVKDHCHIYLEYITKGKDKDFQCVDENLSVSTYKSCFKVVFSNVADSPEKKFQQKVEHAIFCTDKSHKLCSSSAKTSLNQMARIILRMEKENIEDEVKPKEPKEKFVEEDVKPKEPKKELEEEVKPKEPKKKLVEEEVKPRDPEKGDVEDVKPEKEYIEQEMVPKKEDKEYIEEVRNSEPPKKWYDVILQPFISVWRAVKTFFGF